MGAPCGALSDGVARTLPGVLLGRPRPRASDRRAQVDNQLTCTKAMGTAGARGNHFCRRPRVPLTLAL